MKNQILQLKSGSTHMKLWTCSYDLYPSIWSNGSQLVGFVSRLRLDQLIKTDQRVITHYHHDGFGKLAQVWDCTARLVNELARLRLFYKRASREQLGSAPLKSSSQLVWLASQTTKMQNAVHGDFIKAVSNKHKVIIFLTMESIIQPSIDPQFQSFCPAHCPPQPWP